MPNRFHVITGGPGAGKTCIIDAARRRGVSVMGEGGREIIQSQRLLGGEALPELRPDLFLQSLLTWHLCAYRLAEANAGGGPVLFDRGFPDVIGTSRWRGWPVTDHVDRAVGQFRYNPIVFVTPPWEAIYTTDDERSETFPQAKKRFAIVVRSYIEVGYTIEEIPTGPVEERTSWVLREIERA